MAAAVAARAGFRQGRRPPAQPVHRPGPPWHPVWSTVAAWRAVQAVVVIPGLFAVCLEVIGNRQMATYVAFGGFATLVFAGFEGSRWDKARAHLVLAVAGSGLLVLGTLVSSTPAAAAPVTLLVGFVVLFAGVIGPNVASSVTAAMLLFVLPAASPGTIDTIPSRLAGWWLVSVVGTAAALVLAPPWRGDAMQATAADTAAALGKMLRAAGEGDDLTDPWERVRASKRRLLDTFTNTPYRPTGLATVDQALSNMVEMLEWCTQLAGDLHGKGGDLFAASGADRALLRVAGEVLSDTAALLETAGGTDSQRANLVRRGPGTGSGDLSSEITGRLEELEQLRARSLAELGDLAGSRPGPDGAARQVSGAGSEVSDTERYRETVDISFSARAIAVAARTATADALVATRRASPATLDTLRRSWFGVSSDGATSSHPKWAGLASGARVVVRHVSLRSVSFQSAARGAVALAAAVAVADLSDVQHGFWVVLGALSVLRTNAASTGATALRALLGTAVGFAVGGALLLGIGSSAAALWVALPVAVLVAAYAPGAAPFVVGQAGFTVFVAVLFNLLSPVGWKVGELRVEDVAIGCGVSVVVGLLFWPRGAGVAVSGDLADAFSRGADYLRQATAWALGFRPQRPNTGPAAVATASELEDGLRQLLTEQGAKRVSKQDLWRLVGGATRLRLAAHSLEGVPFSEGGDDPAGATLDEHADRLAGWYDAFAQCLQHGQEPAADHQSDHWDWSVSAGVPRDRLIRRLWIAHHLRYLDAHRAELLGPAARLAEERRRAWWR